ncbi:MAG: hypothetical protein HY319_26030 [Armatimonadetes bacterium]|nr:hypothetical protein [Armatimonadota bacterium]
MKVGPFASLAEMARKAPLDEVFSQTLKEKGIEVLDQALDTFYDPARDVRQARTAVKDLEDLEDAFKALTQRPEKAFLEDEKRLEELRRNAHLEPASEHKTESGRVIEAPEEIQGGFVTRSHEPDHLDQFIKDLHHVSPLYQMVAMIPGPMSLTVKDFAREVLVATHQSLSAAAQESDSTSRAFSLLLLGGQSSSHDASAVAASSSEGQVQAEKISIDERVVPVLRDLKDRLKELALRPAVQTELTASRWITVLENQAEPQGFFGRSTQREVLREEHESWRSLGTFEARPARIWLPGGDEVL